ARAGEVHATLLRSPYAHARIDSIDVSAALALDGVVDVVTAASLPPGIRIPMRMFMRAELEPYLQPPLAEGVARYAGEPVAVVLADSRYRAEDAAELVSVDYEPLGAVVDPAGALQEGATPLHVQTGTNPAASFLIEKGDVDAVFAAADVVVEETIRCGRHAAVPLETRGLLAELEPLSGDLVVYGAAKVVHVNRRILARLLRWPEERIRLVEPCVGGGFGARGGCYPGDFLIPYGGIRVGRPVRWIEDRAEHLRSANHSREQVHEIAIALAADGRFLGLRDRFLNNTGAYVRTHGLVVPGMTAALLPGPY